MKRSWIAGFLVLGTGFVIAQMKPRAAAFMEAMDAGMSRMDRDMTAASMSGEIDRDFATMMIPHHQSAIDMAKAELSYGKDPVRRLANSNRIAVSASWTVPASHRTKCRSKP